MVYKLPLIFHLLLVLCINIVHLKVGFIIFKIFLSRTYKTSLSKKIDEPYK